MSTIAVFSIILSMIVLANWLFVPQQWRSRFILAASVGLAACASLFYTVYFLLNTAVIYAAGQRLLAETPRRKTIVKAGLFWLVGNLFFYKYGGVLCAAFSKLIPAFHPLSPFDSARILLPLGLSYIIFRLIHYLVEAYRRNIPKSAFTDFALYIFFFPTFLAGPVERFNRFQPQTAARAAIRHEDVNYGLFRIASGIVKKFIIADTLTRYITPVLVSPQGYRRAVVISAVFGLAIRIYMDFSGYTDMALGVSRLLGYTIMENFYRPFFQKNIALFWRNWHISVSSWIRDYFFFPVFGYHASIAKLYAGIFLSMVVFHLWHAPTTGFLIMGIYHGSGLVCWQLFQEAQRKFPELKRALSHKWLDPVSTACTFCFVSFGFIFFNTDIAASWEIIKRIFS